MMHYIKQITQTDLGVESKIAPRPLALKDLILRPFLKKAKEAVDWKKGLYLSL